MRGGMQFILLPGQLFPNHNLLVRHRVVYVGSEYFSQNANGHFRLAMFVFSIEALLGPRCVTLICVRIFIARASALLAGMLTA